MQHLTLSPPNVDVPVVNDSLEPGTRIEVLSRFDQSWADGFEIVEEVDGGYRVRRLSDGAALPVIFPADEIRPERRTKRGMWWY